MKKKYVYANSEEKHVMATILYANASKKLFYDEKATSDAVVKADLVGLFTKGVVISSSSKYYVPVCLDSTGLIANDGTSTALTFTAA